MLAGWRGRPGRSGIRLDRTEYAGRLCLAILIPEPLDGIEQAMTRRYLADMGAQYTNTEPLDAAVPVARRERGGFLSRIRNLFTRPVREVTREVRERVRPQPPPRQPRQPVGEREWFTAGAPQYDPRRNTWEGISPADWRTMQRLMDRQIREGANYNDALTTRTWGTEDERRGLKPRDRERLYIDAYPPSQRYGYIIDILEGGLLTPQDMLRHLKDSERLLV